MKNLILNQFKKLDDKDRSSLFSKIYESNFLNSGIGLISLFLIHIPILFFDYNKFERGLWEVNLGYEYIFTMHIILYLFLFIFLIGYQVLKKRELNQNFSFFFTYSLSFFLHIWCAIFSGIGQKLFGDFSIYVIGIFGLSILFKFKAVAEILKFTFGHFAFIYSAIYFQTVPERTEIIILNSTVAASLAFIASRVNFSIKIKELASFFIILNQKKELSNEKEKAEVATKGKNDFVANMSNEIQSQINGVIGILQLLDSTKLNEEQKEYVTIIDSSVKNLLTIINDIFDFTRLEAGKTELEHSPFELPSLIKEILLISSSIASLNNNIVRSSISSDVPKHILGDRIRLSQILLNLLGNAIKFTKSGRIDLRVSLKERSGKQVILEFEVRDTGIGIPENRISTIFEMYKKGEISSSRKYKGSGFGLAISKSLVEMMQGNIGLNSLEGKGTIFHFTIKSEDCDDSFKKNTEDTAIQEISQKKIEVVSKNISLKILLVDDNEINIKLGKKVFEKLGYKVKTAYDGKEAVDICQREEFDIIFMDLRMPVLNGFEAAELINKNKKDMTDKPLIIALTANSSKADKEKCLQVGMIDFVSKPLDVSRIKEYIAYIIHKYNITHQ